MLEGAPRPRSGSRPPAACRCRASAASLSPVPADRRIDAPRPRPRTAADEREIPALHLAAPVRSWRPRTRPPRARRRAGRTCHGRVGGRSARPGRHRLAAPSARSCASERRALVRPARGARRARRLVDHEEVLVLEASATATGPGATFVAGSGRTTSTDVAGSSRVALRAPARPRAPRRRAAASRRGRGADWRGGDARSRREPASVLSDREAESRHARAVLRRAFGKDERAEQDGDSDDDERVCEIEGRPRLEVEEVGHMAEPDAVYEVRRAAADDEAERDRQDRVSLPGACEEPEHTPTATAVTAITTLCGWRRARMRCREFRTWWKRERPDDRRFPTVRARDDPLRDWSATSAAPDHGEERDRCALPRRERTLRGEDRPHGVRRRADADVDRLRVLGSGSLPRPLQYALVVETEGGPRNCLQARLRRMPRPHFVHVPHVPASSRASAAFTSSSRRSAFSSSPSSSSRMVRVRRAVCDVAAPTDGGSPVSSSSEPSWLTPAMAACEASALWSSQPLRRTRSRSSRHVSAPASARRSLDLGLRTARRRRRPCPGSSCRARARAARGGREKRLCEESDDGVVGACLVGRG